MHRLKNRGIATLTVLGLFALSGIAMADAEDDTVFNYGYEEENQFLIWNVSSLDYEPDSELLEEALEDDTITDEEFEALLASCRLEMEEEEEGITFDGYEYDAETGDITLTSGGTAIEWPVECNDELNGGFVTGPNGQVNHGMFLKLVNEMYDGPAHRGCIIRHFAQSDLGKPDTGQEKADPEFETEEPESIMDGQITFTTVETNCIHGEKGEGRGGPPQHILEKHSEKWAGDGPGKSGTAPGHSKGD